MGCGRPAPATRTPTAGHFGYGGRVPGTRARPAGGRMLAVPRVRPVPPDTAPAANRPRCRFRVTRVRTTQPETPERRGPTPAALAWVLVAAATLAGGCQRTVVGPPGAGGGSRTTVRGASQVNPAT